ncbi:D-hexose-6-phosphate mutarotase [Aquitalea pelogenes]|uniref:D-hexose-6-phosphate mutarotase n=1 Tax=Aquitalea pelogenes TaxID=1293573 RepID=UPI000A537F1C|nr:D-hexose-6-phosphate mutarotase [Aquitalea pelogenes]
MAALPITRQAVVTAALSYDLSISRQRVIRMSISLPAAAQLIPLGNALTLLQLDGGSFSATLSLLGGQLLSFQPYGQQPWLYMSPQAMLQQGKAIRGGVPVCWPWFGPHPTDTAAPAHGVARQQDWQLLSVEQDGDAFHVKLQGPHWQGLDVELEYTLSDHIAMQLHTHNHSQQPHTVSTALHSYLAVSDSRRIQLSGVEEAVFEDKVAARYSRLPSSPLQLNGEFDAIVYSEADVILHDPQWQRRLRISRSGSGSVVLWNPWQDKAARLADLPDEGWHDFVCIEAANAGEDSYTLEPGSSHTLGCQIRAD